MIKSVVYRSLITPLDIAIANKGYFQVDTGNGIKLTRDGRFKLDKEGYLVSQLNEKVLSNNGTPVKLPRIPADLNQIRIDKKGAIYLFDPATLSKEYVTTIGVVSDDSTVVVNPGVHQGYNEYSNVQLGSEFMRIMPARRNFDANRKMFSIQSSALTRLIERMMSA